MLTVMTKKNVMGRTDRCLLFNRSDNVPLSRLFSWENLSNTVLKSLQTLSACWGTLILVCFVWFERVHVRLALARTVVWEDGFFRLVATTPSCDIFFGSSAATFADWASFWRFWVSAWIISARPALSRRRRRRRFGIVRPNSNFPSVFKMREGC